MSFRDKKGRFIKGANHPFKEFLELGRKWKKDNALTDEQKKERGWYYVGKIKYFWRDCKSCGKEYQGQGAEFCSYTCSRLYQEALKSGRKIKTIEELDVNYYKRIRSSIPYQNWRRSVYKRDNYTCVLCGETEGQLDVDHYPKSFIEILRNNNISTLNDALFVDELWDINNGRTLCVDCHRKTDTYGSKVLLKNKKNG